MISVIYKILMCIINTIKITLILFKSKIKSTDFLPA